MIGMFVMDKQGDIFGVCIIFGFVFKMYGRVGDLLIIGVGLFVDNEIGGVVVMGMGEVIVKVCGFFFVVELMWQGCIVEEVCRVVVECVVKKQKNYEEFQVCFFVLWKDGFYGGYVLYKGFIYVVFNEFDLKIIKSFFYLFC